MENEFIKNIENLGFLSIGENFYKTSYEEKYPETDIPEIFDYKYVDFYNETRVLIEKLVYEIVNNLKHNLGSKLFLLKINC